MDVDPTTEDDPAGHATHALAPGVEYVPAVQFAHALAFVAPVAPKFVPAMQSVHASLPLLVLYFPATQAVQEPAGPVKPALQGNTQALTDKLPLGEVVPAGQVTHLSDTAHEPLHSQHCGHAPLSAHQG